MSVMRPAFLVGGAILAMAAGAGGVWLTRSPDAVPPRATTASTARPAEGRATLPVAPRAPSIVVPEAPPPPELTSADFAPAAGAPAADAPPTVAATPAAPPAEAAAAAPTAPIDWAALPIDELRARANAEEVPAMEEMARRLVQGVGVPKDQQAGAGWLLRAAQHGSALSAYNVGVMYERGFIVERDSTRAIEWYRKAVEGNLALAKHDLALMLREGKGAPRNGQEAVELLRSASRQGMAVSMFALSDMYERGDAVPKDLAMALAWYAITAEFERQTNRAGESALANAAAQRAQVLRRTLLPGELERAQLVGQSEFKQIVEALRPPKPLSPLLPSALPPAALPAPALPAPSVEAAVPPPPAAEPDPGRPPGWPTAVNDQIRVIQEALVELKFLRDKPDGAMGPLTRVAIRTFQRSVGTRETGEPTMDVFVALQEAMAHRDTVASAAPAVPALDLGKPEPPPAPPTSADIARAMPESAKPPATVTIDIGTPEPPPPPTSADIAAADPDAWPASTADQVKAIQGLLCELNFLREEPDGAYGPATRAAILDYERAASLAQTGEPSKGLFQSLKETRRTMVRKSD